MTLPHIVLLVVAGLCAGAVNAIAGGGTVLTFPALLAVGLAPVTANVTNTVAVWPGYVSSAASYRGQVKSDAARLRELFLLSILGAVLGTALLLTTPAQVFQHLVPYLVLGSTALLALQPLLSRRLSRSDSDDGGDGDGQGVGRAGFWVLRIGVGVAAIYGAYFGGGLGIVLLAVLALGLNAELSDLNGVKTLLSLLINTVALLGFAIFSKVDWVAVLVIAPASLTGGLVGARLAMRLNSRVLRVVVVTFGTAVGIRLLVTS